MRVRAAGADDRESLLALRCALWPERDPDDHRRAIALRADAPLRHEILVLQEGAGPLLGFIELTREAGDPGERARVRVHGLFVAPPARRRGGARALLDAAERWAHARGASTLVFELDAHSEAIACLEHLGFGGARRTVRLERAVSAPIELAPAASTPARPAAPAPAPAARAGAGAGAPSRGPLFLVLNVALLAAAVASFLATDIFSRDPVRGMLLPLLDVAFVVYFMFLFVMLRYRKRTDASARAAELFRRDE